MLRPHLEVLRLGDSFRQAACISAIGGKIGQQVVIGAAVTVPPVIDGADQFPFFATSIEPYQALMICPATVGISSS